MLHQPEQVKRSNASYCKETTWTFPFPGQNQASNHADRIKSKLQRIDKSIERTEAPGTEHMPEEHDGEKRNRCDTPDPGNPAKYSD